MRHTRRGAGLRRPGFPTAHRWPRARGGLGDAPGILREMFQSAASAPMTWPKKAFSAALFLIHRTTASRTPPPIPDAPLRVEKKRCRDEIGRETERFMGNVMYFPRALHPVQTQRGAGLCPLHT